MEPNITTLKLCAHGMLPMRFLSACVWFRDVTSFSDASGMVCVRVEHVSILTHQTHCSDSILLERRPYQTHQKRMWRHEIRRMRPTNAQDACRVHPALCNKKAVAKVTLQTCYQTKKTNCNVQTYLMLRVCFLVLYFSMHKTVRSADADKIAILAQHSKGLGAVGLSNCMKYS